MLLKHLILSAVLCFLAVPATAQTFSLETSWTVPGARDIVSDGNRVWVVNAAGSTVTAFDASGGEIGSWPTGFDETGIIDRGIEVDGSGFVYVMIWALDVGGTVRKFQDDGTLVSEEPFEFPGKLGFVVDVDGNIHGGDDSFDDAIALVALGPDGTRYLIDLESYDNVLYADGPGHTLLPGGLKCGGPTNRDESCYVSFHAAATNDRLYVPGYWCDAESNCGFAIRIFGPNHVLVSEIEGPHSGPITLGSPGVLYILNGEMIQKWVASTVTSAPRSTWGALKIRWR
jgi:hypothetical protein